MKPDFAIRGCAESLVDADVDALVAIATPHLEDRRLRALLVRDENQVEILIEGLGAGTSIEVRRIDGVWTQKSRSDFKT